MSSLNLIRPRISQGAIYPILHTSVKGLTILFYAMVIKGKRREKVRGLFSIIFNPLPQPKDWLRILVKESIKNRSQIIFKRVGNTSFYMKIG